MRTDPGLLESEAVLLDRGGAEIARVEAARGSPDRPLDEAALAAKADLAGRGALAGRRSTILALARLRRPVLALAEARLAGSGTDRRRRTWSDG